jgi:hypothetical protein
MEDTMRNDNHAANLFAALGQFQGNATANTRMDRIARVLAIALVSSSARPERPIAKALARLYGDAKRVVKYMRVAVSVRRHAAHLPQLAGDGQALWLLGSRMSPTVCSVS